MPNFRSCEKFHTPNALGTANGSSGLPPWDPEVACPRPIVLLPLKLEDGAIKLNDRSVSFQLSRAIPAGLLNAVLASYALAASPAKALAIQSALPSRRAKPAARTGRVSEFMEIVKAIARPSACIGITGFG